MTRVGLGGGGPGDGRGDGLSDRDMFFLAERCGSN